MSGTILRQVRTDGHRCYPPDSKEWPHGTASGSDLSFRPMDPSGSVDGMDLRVIVPDDDIFDHEPGPDCVCGPTLAAVIPEDSMLADTPITWAVVHPLLATA